MTCSPNFGYAPPQKLKINHTFQQIRGCYRRILPVLLSYHSIELVEKKNIPIIPPWLANASGVFLCWRQNIFKFTR